MIPLRLGGFVALDLPVPAPAARRGRYDLTYQAFNRGLGVLLWGPVVRVMSLADPARAQA